MDPREYLCIAGGPSDSALRFRRELQTVDSEHPLLVGLKLPRGRSSTSLRSEPLRACPNRSACPLSQGLLCPVAAIIDPSLSLVELIVFPAAEISGNRFGPKHHYTAVAGVVNGPLAAGFLFSDVIIVDRAS